MELLAFWNVIENFLIILGGTIIGSVSGSYGVYKWSSISMEINRLDGENNRYEGEINLLKNNASHLKQDVSDIQSSIDDLKRDTTQLNESLEQFEDLRKSLQDLSGQHQVLLLCIYVYIFVCMSCLN